MRIKLVILDIDGVMTDGRKYYGLDGMSFAKTYCDKDFTAIKRLRAAGTKVCFLSGDPRINAEMARKRNIDFHGARGVDKATFVERFELRYEVPRQHMLYIGDDLFDKTIMEAGGHAYCPADAVQAIKKVCGPDNVLSNRGGENVVSDLVEVLLDRSQIDDCTMEDIENLDKKEVF